MHHSLKELRGGPPQPPFDEKILPLIIDTRPHPIELGFFIARMVLGTEVIVTAIGATQREAVVNLFDKSFCDASVYKMKREVLK